MDAKSFASFLKETLINEAKKYEGNLLSVNFDNITDAKRCGGIRDTLVGVANSLDGVIADFYKNGGNTLPFVDTPNIKD
jgi:hypothetical protein